MKSVSRNAPWLSSVIISCNYRHVWVESNCLNPCSNVFLSIVWINDRRVMPKFFYLSCYILKRYASSLDSRECNTSSVMVLTEIIIVMFILYYNCLYRLNTVENPISMFAAMGYSWWWIRGKSIASFMFRWKTKCWIVV